MVALEIKKALQELSIACEVICEAEKCRMCPLKDCCLVDYSILDISVDEVAISRMLCMAEIITEREEEKQKTEAERAWEAEADYWNDRRCDPDYE